MGSQGQSSGRSCYWKFQIVPTKWSCASLWRFESGAKLISDTRVSSERLCVRRDEIGDEFYMINLNSCEVVTTLTT